MSLRRAISLVPSATDTLVALGAGASLVGLSSDCDQPDPERPLPVVSRAAIDPASAARDPAGTDLAVRANLEAGRSLYELGIDTLVALAPDVVFAQDQCSVCAVPSGEVVSGLARHGISCDVVSLDPVGLDEVLATFARIGRAVGDGEAGEALEASCRQRLARLRALRPPAAVGKRPRVLVLDWVDPAFAAGNWVPELVEAAGGDAVLVGPDRPGPAGRPAPSRQVTVSAVVASRPDVVVVAPCGLGIQGSADAARTVAGWFAGLRRPRLIAFDGRIWFSRPGPRLVEGAETLSALLSGKHLSSSPMGGGVVEITEGRDDERERDGLLER